MNVENSSRLFPLLFSSFNGCLLGGLLGDVFGRPFEGASKFTKEDVVRHFGSAGVRPKGTLLNRYSDDTVMTMDVIRSLTKYPDFNAENMARHFATSCISSFIDRYYGGAVTKIFEKWVTGNYRDLWGPAEKQFGGQGSFGNGAAMRVSPVGLLFSDMTEDQETKNTQLKNLVKLILKTSLLTHTHPLGLGGAVFQAVAVRNAFQCRIKAEFNTCPEPESPLNCILNGIEQDLKSVHDLGTIQVDLDPSKEKEIDAKSISAPYIDKLNTVRQLLESKNVEDTEVVTKLGNGVAALNSVPTALYCFLKSLTENNGDKSNLLERTLQHAISLGGDTDTIASMAGSLVGTFLGDKGIPENLRSNAEGVTEMCDLTQKFYDAFYIFNSNDQEKGTNSKI